MGATLDRLECRHAWLDRPSLVMLGEHVTLGGEADAETELDVKEARDKSATSKAGTGCVHTAPGHGHDDFGLATAAAVAAVQAGASWVHGTVNGLGERAGNANRLEVALALEALYGIPTRLDLTKARELAALVQKRSGYQLAPWAPLTGENLFTRESGAVASQFHDPPSIEPYAAGLVGADRGIVLGKKSGLDSIRLKAEELGLELPEERFPEVLAAVKRLGTEKRRLVTDAEFRELAAID